MQLITHIILIQVPHWWNIVMFITAVLDLLMATCDMYSEEKVYHNLKCQQNFNYEV